MGLPKPPPVVSPTTMAPVVRMARMRSSAALNTRRFVRITTGLRNGNPRGSMWSSNSPVKSSCSGPFRYW